MSNSYITLGQGRNSIFQHVTGVLFLKEFEVSWSWNTLLSAGGMFPQKLFFKVCNLAHSGVSSDIIMTNIFKKNYIFLSKR